MESDKLDFAQDVKESNDRTLRIIRYYMNSLPNYINKIVKCIYWELGDRKEIEGELNKVLPYDRIVIGNSIISFVGNNDAIEQISTDGEIIYNCLNARGYEGCHAYDHFALVGAQHTLLGRSVKYESLKQIAEMQRLEKIAQVSAISEGENKSR